MKRIIFIFMILVLALSVFAMNSALVFAEGEDVGDGSVGTEVTLPEGDGTENEGGETLPEGDGTENEGGETLPEGDGTENEGGENSSESENKDSEQAALDELRAALGDFSIEEALAELKGALLGVLENIWNFIVSDDTYKNIATILCAAVAFICIPIVIGAVVLGYIAGGAIVVVSGALMKVVEAIITIILGASMM